MTIPLVTCYRMSYLGSLDEVRNKYGDWTSMSIHLGGDVYTLPPAVDGRLRRFVQVTQDLAGKTLSQLRILDLGCLEAHYAIEFAMHGANVVGIEYRQENLAKARFVREYLDLKRLELYQDDVRNLSREKYGEFDVVICSGILYHLDAPSVFGLVQSVSQVCTRMAIFDTQVASKPMETVTFEGKTYYGSWFREHDESADSETKLKNLWASIDNNRSFWLTPASLANMIETVGFASCYDCLNPHHAIAADRRAYVAVKGSRAEILTSPKTAEMGLSLKPEVTPEPVWKAAGRSAMEFGRRVVPGPIANLVRRSLRGQGSDGFRKALQPHLDKVR